MPYMLSTDSVKTHDFLQALSRCQLFGNIRDIPPGDAQAEDYYTKYRDLYGPISSLTVMGQHIIIVNDAQIAHELLTKRATKYSDRPIMTFSGELCGHKSIMFLSNSGKRFVAMRRSISSQLGSPTAIHKWNKDIEVEVRRYLLRTLNNSQEVIQNVRIESATIILKIVYGYNVCPSGQDVLVDRVEEVMDNINKSSVPGHWIVDIVPALKYLPDWFPGAEFKTIARKWRSDVEKVAKTTFEFARHRTLEGSNEASLVSESLIKSDFLLSAEDAEVLTWSALSMYTGGSDTTLVAMKIFFMAMTKYPEVQRKAHEEIDSHIGTSRLPNHTDRPKLPYIGALVQEVLRWQPVVPVNIPHVANENDTYNNYSIPKGSMVLVNIHGIFTDPTVYPDPDDFNPERFLGKTPQLDPYEIAFGFGRRICPGRYLAMSNLWMKIAMTLATLEIKSIKDHEPELKFTPGILRHPVPFKIDIRA